LKNLVRWVHSEGKGFTLIELLIVIVIIGILAVAVLAAIDPIEQIRRGRDTARQAAAKELLSALERYYGVQESYPWEPTSKPDGSGCCSNEKWTSTWNLDDLVTQKELKAGFENRSPIANEELFLSEDDEGNLHVCFLPESKAFTEKADCAASDGTDCDGVHAPDEYFCVPDSTQ